MLDTIDDIAQGSWQNKFYTVFQYTMYILFAVAFTGIVSIDPMYLSALETFIKYYVSLFLIIRFNPWAKKAKNFNSHQFDRKMAFAGGVFILLTTTASQFVHKYTLDAASHVINKL